MLVSQKVFPEVQGRILIFDYHRLDQTVQAFSFLVFFGLFEKTVGLSYVLDFVLVQRLAEHFSSANFFPFHKTRIRLMREMVGPPLQRHQLPNLGLDKDFLEQFLRLLLGHILVFLLLPETVAYFLRKVDLFDLVTTSENQQYSASSSISSNNSINKDKAEIVEAKGWIVDAQGNIEFVAEVPEVENSYERVQTADCELLSYK